MWNWYFWHTRTIRIRQCFYCLVNGRSSSILKVMMMVCLWTNCLNVCDPNGQISQEHQKKNYKILARKWWNLIDLHTHTDTHTHIMNVMLLLLLFVCFEIELDHFRSLLICPSSFLMMIIIISLHQSFMDASHTHTQRKTRKLNKSKDVTSIFFSKKKKNKRTKKMNKLIERILNKRTSSLIIN